MGVSEKAKILLVEDDPTQLKIASYILGKGQQYDVLEAKDAEEAIELARTSVPAIIISDYYLPGENGLDLCKRVKEHHSLRNTMFMLLTAESKLDEKVKALEGGADEYISKPYHEDELLSRVRALLRIHCLQDEIQRESDELRVANKILQTHFGGTLNLLTKLITLRVPNASSNAEKAAHVSRWIGERLHLDDSDMHSLELVARLHEIGKISFPDPLFKHHPDALTEEEWTRFAEFPLLGEVLLQGVPELSHIAKMMRHQLENYDGSGFPDKLMGQEIHICSRILRAVNFLERSTRADVPGPEGLFEHLSKARGTILDPHVTQLLREYLQISREPSWMEGKEEISVQDLREGMVLASDLCTGNGTKLLPRDTRITQAHVSRIHTQHHFDPIINSIYIYSLTRAVDR